MAPSWFGGVPTDGQEEWLTRCGVPVVLVERSAPPGNPAAGLDRVRTDRAHGAAVAVGHFAALGHRRVTAVLQEGPHATPIGDGFQAAARARGLEIHQGAPNVREYGDYEASVDYLTDAVRAHGVTAALVHSDEDAIVLVPRLQARGVRVPEDLALIAYDDQVAPLADVPLTAIAPPKRSVGELATGILLRRIAERAGRLTPDPANTSTCSRSCTSAPPAAPSPRLPPHTDPPAATASPTGYLDPPGQESSQSAISPVCSPSRGGRRS